ncbi:hypothetical protein HMSSN036_86460 [Paenibacillus macerans]|nr:hypothetical protein HMSSN036_86460 [Paenibacillus macerans]
MFNLNEIKELIELVDKTSIQEVEIENEGARLCIRKPGKSEIVQVQPQLAAAAPQNVPAALAVAPAVNEPAAQPAKPAENAANLHTIASPMVGTFLSFILPRMLSLTSTSGTRLAKKPRSALSKR